MYTSASPVKATGTRLRSNLPRVRTSGRTGPSRGRRPNAAATASAPARPTPPTTCNPRSHPGTASATATTPSRSLTSTCADAGNRNRQEEDVMTVQPGGQQPDGQQPDGRKLGGGAIASLTGLGVLLIFITQNTERVRFQFLFWTFTWPLWWYTIMTALFGALVWFGLGVMRRHRRRVERRAAR